MFAGIVAALVVGAVIGAAVGVWSARRTVTSSTGHTPGEAATSDSAPRRSTVGDDGNDVDGADHRDDDRDDDRDDIGSTLRAAVDQLALGVVVADATGRTVYRNRTAQAFSGTHAGLIIEDHVERALRRARDGERLADDVELHGPPRLFLQLNAVPMSNGSSVATIEDVSDRSRIEMMRTDFVANISHELKTPVGAIAVLAEALLGEDDPEVVERLAGRMMDEAHRATSSIDDLLELSRIESGPRESEVVALADVVAVAIGRGRALAEAGGVKLTVFDCGDDTRVRGDRRQLDAAVGNLVENAVKYSGPDGVVQVRTRRDARGVEIMVADQGDGIPARDLDRIFERFYRIDRSRRRETGGSGLGLSIVRHVAQNHGGEVLVSSTEGEGSTFVFRLPAALVVDDAADHEPSEVRRR